MRGGRGRQRYVHLKIRLQIFQARLKGVQTLTAVYVVVPKARPRVHITLKNRRYDEFDLFYCSTVKAGLDMTTPASVFKDLQANKVRVHEEEHTGQHCTSLQCRCFVIGFSYGCRRLGKDLPAPSPPCPPPSPW